MGTLISYEWISTWMLIIKLDAINIMKRLGLLGLYDYKQSFTTTNLKKELKNWFATVCIYDF